MEYYGQIALLAGKTFAAALFSPFFLLMVFLIGWQYKRIQSEIRSSKPMEKNRRYIRSTLVAAGAGVVGGIIGSVLMLLAGIDLSGIGIKYLLAIALGLMLIHPRFICFAYAGGVLALFYLIFGFPEIDIAQLMGLVAILHMVEAILILTTGHLDPVPVYIARGQDEMVGGFNLQKFWPIPLVAVMNSGMVSGSLLSGGWWPLLGEDSSSGLVMGMAAVLAILGYGEVTTTDPPQKRAKVSAFYLANFSMVLFVLAVIGSHFPALLFLPALFAPLGHEMAMIIGQRSEMKRDPLYVNPPEGVMILEVEPGSRAALAGLKSRDVIVAVNGVPVSSGWEFSQALVGAKFNPQISFLRGSVRKNVRLDGRIYDDAGIILVPDRVMPSSAFKPSSGFISLLAAKWNKFWG